MIWLLTLLLIMNAAFIELRIAGEFHHAETTEGQLCVSLGRLRRVWRFRLVRTAQGHRLVIAHEHGARSVAPGDMHAPKHGGMTQLLRRAAGARRFLLRHIHWDTVQGLLLLRMDNAAHSALVCGAAAGILRCIPALHRAKLCVLPEFFRPHSTVHLKCIIRVKVGTIILTAGMLLLAWLRMRHPQESEVSAYGTSHR